MKINKITAKAVIVRLFSHGASGNIHVHRRGAEVAKKCNYGFLLRGQKSIKPTGTLPYAKHFCFPSSQRKTKSYKSLRSLRLCGESLPGIIIFVLASFFFFSPLLPVEQARSEIKAASDGKDAQSAKTAGIQELLGAIGKKASNFRSLKTDFVQEKELAMFKKKIVLRGRIYMKKPSTLAWHVDKPVKYSVVITDKSIKQWDEDTDKVQEMSLSKNPIFKNVVNQLSVWFSGEYGGLTNENNVSVLQQHPLVLEFVPNEKNMARKMIRSITITFRDDEKYLKKIKILEMSGDATTIEFSNTLLDVPLETGFFEVKRV